jgi:hypothetical protein
MYIYVYIYMHIYINMCINMYVYRYYRETDEEIRGIYLLHIYI